MPAETATKPLADMLLSEFENLLETRARRPLNADEEKSLVAWFAEHPEDRGIWEEEEALCGALDSLPDVPYSSNFTSQVWQQIEMASRPEERKQNGLVRFLTGSWLRVPRIAWACALILTFGIAVLQQRTELLEQVAQKQQEKFAESIVPVVELAQLPSLEMLQDFDAINSLSEPMVSGDFELLAALKEEVQ